MSIVEQALSRTKAKQAEAKAPSRPEATRGAIASLPSAAAAPPAPVEVQRGRAKIHIDFNAIAAEGMMPFGDAGQVNNDEFRRIKWPLLATVDGKDEFTPEFPNLVLVASAFAGEGKSFVALNLALSIAAGNRSVVLIDADSAKSRISRLLRISDRTGLIELVSDPDRSLRDVLIETNVPALQLIPSGRDDRDAAELFAQPRAERILHELAAEDPSRVIVIDSAPLMATNEAQVLSRHAGQALFIARCAVTSVAAVAEVARHFDKRCRVRAVLNQVPVGLFSETYGQYLAYHQE